MKCDFCGKEKDESSGDTIIIRKNNDYLPVILSCCQECYVHEIERLVEIKEKLNEVKQ